MRMIRNKTRSPLKIRFAGGKLLHLGPGKTGQIPDQAVDAASIRALLQADKIEMVGGGEAHGPGSTKAGAAPHETTKGHPQAVNTPVKGNR
ncbi:MAG TPA: hypothetical protein VFT43_15040 [Candidatus Polarisedimenticolia bacterium]|nr:hypothetical protein [Candidatus Polarisedimenticolia bacterium]